MVLIAATILLIRLCRKRILLSSSNPNNTNLVEGSNGTNTTQKSSIINDKKNGVSAGHGYVFGGFLASNIKFMSNYTLREK